LTTSNNNQRTFWHCQCVASQSNVGQRHLMYDNACRAAFLAVAAGARHWKSIS
jgi:hypothetical protein